MHKNIVPLLRKGRTTMMKKKVLFISIPIVIIVAAVLVWFFAFRSTGEYIKDVDKAELDKAFNLLANSYLDDGESPEVYYTDFIAAKGDKVGEGEQEVSVSEGVNAQDFYADNSEEFKDIPTSFTEYSGQVKGLGYLDDAEYVVNVDKEGMYYLTLDYISITKGMSDYTASVLINGESQFQEAKSVVFTMKWTDTKDFTTDKYGDEMPPTQTKVDEWDRSPIYNNTYVSTTPLCFYLNKGENVVTIKNESSAGLVLGSMTISAAKDNTPSYKDYAAKHSSDKVVSKDAYQLINAIDYTRKNSTQAIYESKANSALTPFDVDDDKLNIMTWNEAGTELTYSFEAKETGLYKLALHMQNNKDEFSSFAKISIDGEVPFAELNNFEIKSDKSGWQNVKVADKDGNDYLIYIEKGDHELTIKSEISPVMEAYRYALLIEQHVTQFQLAITKITGKDVDRDRAWKMTKYIPEIKDYLEAYQTLITHMRFLLQDYSEDGNEGAILAYLDQAELFIEKDLEYPDEIALYTANLTGADNSVLTSLSNFTTGLLADKLSLDAIYAYGDSKIPRANQSGIKSFGIGVKQLVNTFVSKKYSNDITKEDEKTVTIWMNKAVTYVDLIQKMADTQFTPETGIKVRVTPMPDANKISMAVAANETPDLALELSSFMPFDLASRNAIYNMANFDDFWQTATRFPSGSFVSYVYNEGVYAIPETTDFNAIIYRKDIFDSLGLEVPNTWDDLVKILPTLQRYGMNFYHNIGVADVSYKWFYQTTPMLLQNGGKLYEDDGTRTAIDSKEAVAGIQRLGDLFTKYSLPTSVGRFFNSFRYSQLPIGIIGMEDYTLIKNGAPELSGQWAIAPYIGTEQADGSINRTFVANGQGAVMFKEKGQDPKSAPTDKQKDAWEFLKWWTSQEVQTNYAYTLRSTYGKNYFWLSANLEALKDVPMDEGDKQIVLEQVNYVTDVSRTPGQYLLERTISNIWTTMVFDGTPAQVAVDEAKLEVNREIQRKMTELGFFDADGEQIKDYVIRGKDWIEQKQNEARGEGGIE